MRLNLRKTRRQKKALELVCEILKVTDKVLDDFIENETVPKEKGSFAEKMKAAKDAKKDKE